MSDALHAVHSLHAADAASAARAADAHADTPDADADTGRVRAHPRPSTVSVKRLSKRELERDRLLNPPLDPEKFPRPRTRGDCLTAREKVERAAIEDRRPRPDELVDGCNAQRPCAWVSCRHHMALDVNERTGSIKTSFPDLEVWELPETCKLDIADRGGLTLEEVGEYMNLTRERVRQIETRGLAKLVQSAELGALAELVGIERVDVPVGSLRRKRRVKDAPSGGVADDEEGPDGD